MKPIDFSKPVQTRDGRKVRVLCTDRRSGDIQPPVIALVEDGSNEYLEHFCINGSYRIDGVTSSTDLINAPERVERWVNVYGTEIGVLNSSIEGTNEQANAHCRVGLIRITYEDGKPVAVALEDAQ